MPRKRASNVHCPLCGFPIRASRKACLIHDHYTLDELDTLYDAEIDELIAAHVLHWNFYVVGHADEGIPNVYDRRWMDEAGYPTWTRRWAEESNQAIELLGAVMEKQPLGSSWGAVMHKTVDMGRETTHWSVSLVLAGGTRVGRPVASHARFARALCYFMLAQVGVMIPRH